MKEQKTLNGYLAQAIRDNWDTPALTDFRGITYQYRDSA